VGDEGERNLLAEQGFIGYRCYLIGLDGTIDHRVELRAADDSAAADATQAVLGQSVCFCAELWFLDRRISQFMRVAAC
jgi:hypothetical protein